MPKNQSALIIGNEKEIKSFDDINEKKTITSIGYGMVALGGFFTGISIHNLVQEAKRKSESRAMLKLSPFGVSFAYRF